MGTWRWDQVRATKRESEMELEGTKHAHQVGYSMITVPADAFQIQTVNAIQTEINVTGRISER